MRPFTEATTFVQWLSLSENSPNGVKGLQARSPSNGLIDRTVKLLENSAIEKAENPVFIWIVPRALVFWYRKASLLLLGYERSVCAAH